MAAAQIKTAQDLISALKKHGMKNIHEVQNVKIPSAFIQLETCSVQQFIKLSEYNFCWDVYVYEHHSPFAPYICAISFNYEPKIAVILTIFTDEAGEQEYTSTVGTTDP